MPTDDDTRNRLMCERLRALIDESGLAQSRISILAGLHRDGVRNMFNGKSKDPGYSTVSRLARVLGCQVAYLGGEPEAERYPARSPAPPSPLEDRLLTEALEVYLDVLNHRRMNWPAARKAKVFAIVHDHVRAQGRVDAEKIHQIVDLLA